MEIHAADRHYRARALRRLLALALLCGALLWLVHGWLAELVPHLQTREPAELRRWLRGLLAGLAVMLAVPPLLLGISLRRLGRAACAEARYPSAAWKTLRDVRVLRGEAARRWGRRTERAGAAASAAAGLLLGMGLWAWWRFA